MEHRRYVRLKSGAVICINDIVYISDPLTDGVSRAIVLRGWDKYEYVKTQEDYSVVIRAIMEMAYGFTDNIKREENGTEYIHKDLR